VILASASPRRRRLLDRLGIPYRIDPAGVEESPRSGETALTFCERAARDKALTVAARHAGEAVLAADTVVALGGRTLGKPKNAAEARSTLRRLAGKEHQVHTAIALARDHTIVSLVDTSRVVMAPLDDRLITWYVATGEPMDKAGAYAVQGLGGLLVASVTGHPHTVVGLPIHRLPELFAALGLDLLRSLETHAR